ncbi:haloacid dehalogenase-like hydrolase [Polymorphospora sp. NPDC050346]|uniref:HAD family hydrolase n=1 Tax=Polymorphospora sp. NPDC050346 TaxID=3155780 RepID=UPI0033E82317
MHPRPPRLIMWDIDRTLIHAGRIAVQAYATAFTAVTGLAWREATVFAGRTDRAVTAEILTGYGVADTAELRATFFARYTEEFAARRHLIAASGRVLPGVREVLAALADRTHVTQTLVTGNIPAVALAKVAAFGLDGPFDVAVGGYGMDDPVRAELVARSRRLAEAKYGPFAPSDIVVVGDTVHDVEAALAVGVTAIGVATGDTGTDELAAAGAHLVFTDLGDVDAVVARLAGDLPPASPPSPRRPAPSGSAEPAGTA